MADDPGPLMPSPGGDGAAGTGPTADGRRAARGVLWSGWCTLLGALASVVWLFTIPRALGPERYGGFVVLSSLVDFHTLATGLGIGNVFAYYFPKLKQESGPAAERLASGYALAVGAAGLVGLAALWVAAEVLSGPEIIPVMIAAAAATAALQTGNTVLSGLLYGHNRIVPYSIRFPLQQFVTLGLVVAGALLRGLTGALAGLALGTLVTFAWLVPGVRPWREFGRPPWTLQSLRAPLQFGLLSLFGGLGALTITRGGNVVLAAVGRRPAEIACFAVATSFVLQGTGLLSALATALTPGLARLHAEGEPERATAWAERAAVYVVFAGLAGVGFVAFLGEPLLRAAVGSRYEGLGPVMLSAIGGLVPLSLAGLAAQFSVAWGCPRLNLENWSVLAATYVVSVAGLAAAYGTEGAALGLLIASWVAGLYTGLRLRRAGGPRVWNADVVKLLAAALPGFALLALAGSVGRNAGLFGAFVLYLCAAAPAVGAVRLRELREIVAAVRG